MMDSSGPGPQTLPSCHCLRSQAPRTQLALRLLRPPKQRGPDPENCFPCRLLLPLGRRGRYGGEVHRRLKACTRPVGGLGKGSGALQDTAPSLFPGPPNSVTGSRLGELEGPVRRLGSASYLTLPPPDDHCTADCWLNGPTRSSLTVARLGEGPTAMQTKG